MRQLYSPLFDINITQAQNDCNKKSPQNVQKYIDKVFLVD